MTEEITLELVKSFLHPRQETAGKWSFGRAMLVCGSAGMPGAALLAAEGVLRSGPGLVQLCAVEPVLQAAKIRLPECLLLSLPMEAGGHIAKAALPLLLPQREKAQSLLFGCGAGRWEEGWSLLASLTKGFSGPVVADADGLNLLAADLSPLEQGSWVLTPHWRELCRLAGCSFGRLEPGAAGVAAAFAARHQIVLVLKGAETLVTDGRRTLSLSAPNSGMAKGGSGDLLAGILCGLLAQSPQRPLEMAALSVWLHSQAGLLARRDLGPYAMLPRDILTRLPQAFRQLEGRAGSAAR